MFPRYKLVVRYGNDIVYEKLFSSLNQAVKFSIGFDFELDLYVSISDELLGYVFPHHYVYKLTKEFIYD